jgi:hypothetical protein
MASGKPGVVQLFDARSKAPGWAITNASGRYGLRLGRLDLGTHDVALLFGTGAFPSAIDSIVHQNLKGDIARAGLNYKLN